MMLPDGNGAFGTLDPEYAHPHWLRYRSDSWSLRDRSDTHVAALDSVVQLAYRSLIQKIAGGKIKIDNEASLQLHFGALLQHVGQLYEHTPADLFSTELEKTFKLKTPTTKSKTARIDILLILGDTQRFSICAIELKYFKKRNHREPQNRYDVFADIENLEAYREHGIDLTYLVIATDHQHYVRQAAYSADTGDFDVRHGSTYAAGTTLSYRTNKPYGSDITLSGTYDFCWDTIPLHYKLGGEQFSMLLPVQKDD